MNKFWGLLIWPEEISFVIGHRIWVWEISFGWRRSHFGSIGLLIITHSKWGALELPIFGAFGKGLLIPNEISILAKCEVFKCEGNTKSSTDRSSQIIISGAAWHITRIRGSSGVTNATTPHSSGMIENQLRGGGQVFSELHSLYPTESSSYTINIDLRVEGCISHDFLVISANDQVIC